MARRSAIHLPATEKPAGSIWHVRTRPTFSDRTNPHASNTCKCWNTAGKEIFSGPASSETDTGFSLNISRISRRVESPNAWKTLSTPFCLSVGIQLFRQHFQQAAGALLAPLEAVDAVEEGPLFRQDEVRALVGGQQFHGGQRRGHAIAAHGH